MSETIAFTLNGEEVEAREGETIWQVAARLGVEIPHLCYSPEPGYRADGNCRACMVEIEGERVLAASCIRTPSEGMTVHTASDRARNAHKHPRQHHVDRHEDHEVRAQYPKIGLRLTQIAVGKLRPKDVGHRILQLLHHRRWRRIARILRVVVKQNRKTCRRVHLLVLLDQLPFAAVRVIIRAHDADRVRADRLGMGAELTAGVRIRRSNLNNHRYPAVYPLHHRLGDRLALFDGARRPLALGTQNKEAMHPGIKVKVHQTFHHRQIGLALTVEYTRYRRQHAPCTFAHAPFTLLCHRLLH